MPTYVYRREDGSTFEVRQRITDDPLDTCPETGQEVKRLITGGGGLIFKGSGFYETDYARNGNGSGAASSEEESAASAETASETSSSTVEEN